METSTPNHPQSASNRHARLGLPHRARAAGMNPNHWYPAAFSHDVKRGHVVQTTFWRDPIAVYRGEDGVARAMEDRCPHRQIPLSHGTVEGCNLVCLYHGWTVDPEGRIVGAKHDLGGKKLPLLRNRAFPVRERYGVIWFFPGDPALANDTPLVEIPNGDGAGAWPAIRFAYTWKAHHSMVIDNLCNLTHLWVHGRWVPYGHTVLADYQLAGDRLTLHWEHELRRDILHPLMAAVFRRERGSNLSDTYMVYDYPYQSALSNNRIRSTNFMLPIDEGQTKVFTVQFWKPPSIGSSLFGRLVLPFIKPITKEIFRQDGFTVEEEYRCYHLDPSRPIPELNPSVQLFNELTVRKWEDCLAYPKDGKQSSAKRDEQTRTRTI